MSHESRNILPYAPGPNRWEKFLQVKRGTWIRLGVFGTLILAVILFLRGPTSGQIRLDTGDLRYCWYGIPIMYERMPEPERSKLMALAFRSRVIPAKWVTCVTYPLPTSNNTDSMCRHFYASIAGWADEDPNIGRWAMEDIADYVPGMLTKGGLPRSTGVMRTDVTTGRIRAGWREDEDVRSYCDLHGYAPPPATTGRSK